MSFSVPGSSPGYHAAFSCYVSLVSSNIGERLRLFFKKNFILPKSTGQFIECPLVWFVWCFILIRLRLCIIAKDISENRMPFLMHHFRGTWYLYLISGDVNLALDHLAKVVFAWVLSSCCFPFLITKYFVGDILRLYKYPISA